MAKSLLNIKKLTTGKYSKKYLQLSTAGKEQLLPMLGDIGYNEFFAFCDIDKLHSPNTVEKYKEWKSAKGVYTKLTIRYGEEAKTNEYNRRSKESASHYTCLQTDFWINKGYTLEAAQQEISKLQRNNALTSHKKTPSKERNAYKLEFWTNRGYSLEEAKDKIEDYRMRSVSSSFESFVKRHGLELGPKMFEKSNLKRMNTMMKKYGTTIPSSGAVSKISMSFFVPLYKKLRKLGIQKEDICWGITGSKEFAIHESGRNYFFDFTVKSKKIIVEFNGLFWHPREQSEWRGLYNFDVKKLYDQTKIEAIEKRGYNVIIVWEDDNFQQKYNEIIGKIEYA